MLSIIVKYSLKKILPFLKSFIKNSFENCDVVFFINQISHTVTNYLNSLGIILCEIPGKLDDPRNIYKYRWKFYRDYLVENKEKYNIVLSVDAKDTIFQTEFFKIYENYKPFIGFSYENEYIKKSNDKILIINNFGIDMFKKIENKRIINSGTIWGTLNEFCQFSNILYEKLLVYPQIIDQTLVNYLIYHEKILSHCLQIISDEYGPVITIGLTKRENIFLDAQNNIFNNKGYIYSIIHQYDRHPDLKQIMVNKYCPEITNITNIIRFFIILESFTIILLLKTLISLNKLKKEKEIIC